MKKLTILGVVFAILISFVVFQHVRIATLKKDRDKYKMNTTTLLGAVEQYRTSDSLNAARVGALQLSLDEFKKYREEDAKLIRTLQVRNGDLAAIVTSQTQTIMQLSTAPRDTVIIRDSLPVKAIAIHDGDPWFDFDGILTDSTFSGCLTVRDSILIAESVKYKRFLGFLWRTKRVKSRKIDVVSKNPHTTIMGCEHIIIEK